MTTNKRRISKKKKSSFRLPEMGAMPDFSAWIRTKRFRTGLGLLLMFTSLFLFFSFVSYIFTARADQSAVEAVDLAELLRSGREIRNWLGLVGAVVSYLFVYKWFGLASFLLIPPVFNLGYRLVYEKRLFADWPAVKFVTFGLFWGSLTLGYLTLTAENEATWGFFCGEVGYKIAIFFDNLIGKANVVFLPLLFVIFFILIFGKNPFKLPTLAELKIKFPKTESLFEKEEVSKKTEVRGESEFRSETGPAETPEPAKAGEKISLDIEPIVETGGQLALKLSLAAKAKAAAESASEEKTGEPEFSVEDTTVLSDAALSENEEDTENEDERPLHERVGLYDPTLDLGKYQLPTLNLMDEVIGERGGVTKEELESNKDKIVETLNNFKIGIDRIKATIGPTVTLYEIVPQAGIKISKIKNLEDDIALSLSALGIRIIAPIPGRGTIGIEVPNKNREMVGMRSVLASERFQNTKKDLPVVLGKTISNEVFVADLAKMPHLLMAGATGQGKSVGINALLTSLIYKKHPAELKLVLVDPKKVELSLYNKLERHFLATVPNTEEPIITDTKLVINTLNSLCIEMDVRYNLLKTAGCRNLNEYNAKFVKRLLSPEDGHRFLPFIVLVIDELADLMMTAGKEVETPIARLAQLARAIGIHLVVATQRPSVNVITGIIKANFPARLSFKVTSKVDSRTILDTGGADQLVGRGDMLLSNGSEIIRLQCPFVDTHEVERICEYVGSQQGYGSSYILPEFEDDTTNVEAVDLSKRDSMFEEAARLLVTHQQGSTSLIQRKLSLGYNRAGRIIDQLEAAGVVGGFEGSKARKVLIPDETTLEKLLNSL